MTRVRSGHLVWRWLQFAPGHGLAPLAPMIAVAAAVIAWRLQVYELHEDQSWLIYCAVRVLDGAALYRDLVEINTPIVVFLYIPVALLQMLTGWSFDLSLYITTTAVLLAVIHGTARMLDAGRYGPGERTGLVWLLFLLNLVFSGHHYGQKEHFAVLFLFPFLAHFAAAWGARAERGRTAAVAAGLGFAIKPHFIAVLAALALLALLCGGRKRSNLVADLAIAGAAMAWVYALTFWLAPGFVALSLGLTAKFYVNLASLPYMAVLPLLTGLLPLAAILPLLIKGVQGLRLRDICDRLDAVLLLTVAAFVLVYAAQLKGFLYQLLPALLLGYFLAFKLVWAMARQWWRAGRAMSGAAALALAVALTVPWPLYTAQFLYKGRTTAKAEADPAKRYLRRELAGRSVFMLSSRFYPPFPTMLHAGIHWVSRYPSQWIHPIVRSIARDAAASGDRVRLAEMEALARLLRRHAVEDIRRGRPEYLICYLDNKRDRRRGTCSNLDFFLHDPDFRRLFAGYAKIRDGITLIVYKRIGP